MFYLERATQAPSTEDCLSFLIPTANKNISRFYRYQNTTYCGLKIALVPSQKFKGLILQQASF